MVELVMMGYTDRYSDNQKTLKYEDDFIAILKCI